MNLYSATSDARSLYILPVEPVAKEVLIPALRATKALDVMMGYFSSSSFPELAPGLATFLKNSQAPMRIVISPSVPEADFEVLTRNKDQLEILAQQIFIQDVPDENELIQHTLECFAWLIVRKRLIIKFAVMSEGKFHQKVWLLKDDQNRLALHGSMNQTKSGLGSNREQLTLSRDWKGEDSVFHIERLQEEFDLLWSGGDSDCHVFTLPEAVEKQIVKKYKTTGEPKERDILDAYPSHDEFDSLDDSIVNCLEIPDNLEFKSGDFSHQGEAVKSWENSGRNGILEMATGSGKTITSMVAACRLQNELDSLLVVISAPYRPLINQWCEQINKFNVVPVNLSDAIGSENRNKLISKVDLNLKLAVSRAEILVVSNVILCDSSFIESISKINSKKLLIADECHNLGAPDFLSNPPQVFDYRLGLSATPVRQYDEKGTEELVKYFGKICFAYDLSQAIGVCLTEYDYHVHFVSLTDEEMEGWHEITAQIARQRWKLENDEIDTQLGNLLRKRRLIIETAQNKLKILSQLLDSESKDTLKYALIYATDKDPAQLTKVNSILLDKGLIFHQLTQKETANSKKATSILASFQEGTIQVLTAKRVLDEGVDIPQIELAYVLASTTVRRQWIQRRGRLLRKCQETGKNHATIHDFVVLPPDCTPDSNGRVLDKDERKIVRSELERVWEFSNLSRNELKNNGPHRAVRQLQNLANEWGINTDVV